jgi:hypothetical protein
VALITTGTVTNLIATGASITSANVGALQVTNASVASANFGTAQITAVSAASANLGVAAITTGSVTNLTATSASVASMNAGVALLTTATVTTLNASGASIASANIGNLQFTAASIASINAGVAVINNLTATSASIASANVGVALITTGTVTALTATGASVASANVGTAVITGLTVTGASIASVNAGTATLSGNLTLNGGTANGVLFLNGSKVATSGSALTFDGNALNITPVSGNASNVLTGQTTSGAWTNYKNTTADHYIGANNNAASLFSGIGGANALVLAAYGNLPIAFGINGTEGMRLTSSTLYTASGINVGIGTSSPSARLHVKDATGTAVTLLNLESGYSNPSGNKSILWTDATNALGRISISYTASTGSTMSFGSLYNGGYQTSDLMVLTNTGNLGLGVAPSAWASGYKALQVGATGALWQSTSGFTFLSDNAYVDSGAANRYITSNYATLYRQQSGQHNWFTAPSWNGTGSDVISFTQAMTLDASGRLLVGQTVDKTQEVLRVSGSGQASLLLDNSGKTNGAFVGAFNDAALLGVNRNPSTGTFYNTSNRATDIALVGNATDSYIIFGTSTAANTTPTERARITAAGLLLVNIDTSAAYGSGHRIYRDVAEGTAILSVDGGGEFSAAFYDVLGTGFNVAATAILVGKNSSNSRSINAAGTINASGADYAEYMEKAGEFVIAKGDVCGVDANGKLTNVYADAVAFVVKSTNPSYVGGDSWGAGYKDDPEGLEAARQKVDRIAFSGQVPVNVLGATPGQYIVPVNDNGAIKGVAVSNPSFEQYQTAVGKVIAIEDDGRARIIVKIA